MFEWVQRENRAFSEYSDAVTVEHVGCTWVTWIFLAAPAPLKLAGGAQA
jgi:hypothetical protein